MSVLVIAIAGHSGAGKSTLIDKLSSFVGDANILRMDDYNFSSYPPAVKWIEDGANPNEFQSPQFFSDIIALKNGQSILHPGTNKDVQPAPFLIIEEPFGKGRDAMSKLIDFSIYVDTPLEIALARRLLRMSDLISQGNFEVTVEEHLLWYLRVGRNFYLAVEKSARRNCDLVVDGLLSTDKMAEIVYEALQGRRQE